jgi:hypothetical protein
MRIFLFLFIFISIQAYAQSASGSMDCAVTGSVVIASEEGKFKTYSGIKGGVKANEKLTLNYRVGSNSIYIELKREVGEKDIVVNQYVDKLGVDISVQKNKNGGFILTNSTYQHSLSFLPDYIQIYANEIFFIKRYYKNDWDGIFSSVDHLNSSTQTLTLNCRHTNDNMDAAFKIFNSEKGNSSKK